MNNEILEIFNDLGKRASYHYADDTVSGEWRLGSKCEQAARKLFNDNPDLQDEMLTIAKGFIWTLRKPE